MGAANFFEVGLGKTASEAHGRLVDEALYEHGHDPYSGTIAAKSGGFLIAPPAKGRMTARRIHELALDADEVARYESNGSVVLSAKARKAREALQKWLVDGGARVNVGTFLAAHDDKWEGGICVEVTGTKATEYRKRAGKAGTRQRVYAFFGYAPC